MKLSARWIVIGLALLCLVEVWAKPTDRDEEDSEFQDDAEDGEANDEANDKDNEDSDDESQSLPVLPKTSSQTFVVEAGDSVVMPCEFSNSEKVMISWMKKQDMLYADNSKMTQDKRFDRLENSSLVIRDVTPEDSSEYICSAFISQDQQPKIKHELKVVPSLVRVTPSEHVEVSQDTSLTLGCEYLGNDEPRGLFWSRQGRRIKVDKQSPRGIYLHVNNASRHVAGDYQCLIETGADKPLIRHLKLRVKHKPEIEYEKEHVGEKVREHSHYYTGLGVESNITCVVHAHPPVEKLQWFKDGQKLRTEGRLSKSDDRKSHHVLTIRDTAKSDLGLYQCHAWNELGEAEGPEIHLLDTPDQPVFKRGEVIDDAIVFHWRLVSYKPVVETQLLYRKEGEDEWLEASNVKVISSIGKEHIIRTEIKDIKAGNHEARLRARNDEEHESGDALCEWGPYSELKKFDGEYKNDLLAETVKDSAMSSTFSLMTLLVVVLPLAIWRL